MVRKMFIENNILKHYLKNVYFITGTAYAGKSTMVKMLAEKYGGLAEFHEEGNEFYSNIMLKL